MFNSELLTHSSLTLIIDALVALLKKKQFYATGEAMAELSHFSSRLVEPVFTGIAHYFPLITGQYIDIDHLLFKDFFTGYLQWKKNLLQSIKVYDSYFSGEYFAAHYYQLASSLDYLTELKALTTGLFYP